MSCLFSSVYKAELAGSTGLNERTVKWLTLIYSGEMVSKACAEGWLPISPVLATSFQGLFSLLVPLTRDTDS